MELPFEEKSCDVWRECLYKTERIRVDLEGVVPDVNEDVGRIACVRSNVLLKSKEITESGVRVGGELEILFLCITENADAVQTVTLRKEFESEIAADGGKPGEAQVSLRVLRTEVRVLNPRKLSVTAELGCTVSGWHREQQILSLLPKEGEESLLCGLAGSGEMQLAAVITEKSFAVSESFSLPEEGAGILRVLGGEAAVNLQEHNRIGSRLIVKGTADIRVLCEAEGQNWPVSYRFCAPISQILDAGNENVCCCTLQCETTSVYFDLTDSIGGGKALDVELHAVLQLIGRKNEALNCLKDVYSNLMPLQQTRESVRFPQCGEMKRNNTHASELIAVAEDCADILSILPSVCMDDAAPRAEFDILYRSRMGEISAVHRQVPLKTEGIPEGARILAVTLSQCDLRPEGEGVQCDLTASILWQHVGETEEQVVSSVTLDEEHPYNPAAFPAVTLVRTDEESLWDLAREYHSRIDAITAANGNDETKGKMLLIPRCGQQT